MTDHFLFFRREKSSDGAVSNAISPAKPALKAAKSLTRDDSVFTANSSSSKEDLANWEDDAGNESDGSGGENAFRAAQIVKGPVSVSTLVGSTVLLEALVIGRPEPTVRWLKGVRKKLSLGPLEGVSALQLRGKIRSLAHFSSSS